MKQRQGIIWAPVLIMLGVIVVAGVAGYALLKMGSTSTNENSNTSSANTNLVRNTTTTNTTNSNVHTNTATSNTNSVKNSNTSTSTTADWKTYTSKEYGVAFKYPTTWTVEEGLLNSPYSVYAHPISTSDSSGLRFWLDRSYDGLSTPSGAKTTNTTVSYANRSAVLSKTTTSAGKLLIAHIQFDVTPVGWGASSGITLNPSASGSIATQLQMMDTLTIVDQTLSWKTYTNAEFKVSFKYPTDWSVSSDTVTPVNGDSSSRALSVELRSTDGSTMSLTMNAPGSGLPNPWRNIYTNVKNGKIFVTRTEIVDRSDAYADTEKYSLYVRDISNVLIIFTYKAATESLEFDALAEQILSTFTLNK